MKADIVRNGSRRSWLVAKANSSRSRFDASSAPRLSLRCKQQRETVQINSVQFSPLTLAQLKPLPALQLSQASASTD